MTDEQIEKIMDLVEEGCVPIIEGGGYIDGFAVIFENEDGVIVVESQVYGERPLKSFQLHQIKLYRPVEIE